LGKKEHASRAIADAETGYATLVHFLSDPKHTEHINDEELRELTAGAEKLRKKLDELKR
jgi:hypothetical protein